MRVEEWLVVLLPVITITFIDVWDFLLTIAGAYYCGATELNPMARHLLNAEELHTLVYLKAGHTIISILTFVVGLIAVRAGNELNDKRLYYMGLILLSLFLLAYIVGHIAITLNVASMLYIAKELC